MWINREVNLPEQLVSAQREGKLVVFAGAGISMGMPSNLPDFKRLALEIVAGALVLEEGETLDRFLGRAEDLGMDIQARARQILGSPSSKPTDLHRAICHLFPSVSSFRVLTTNFDTHLSTSTANLHPGSVDTYYAPALPLGHDFLGLVYLHGSLERSRNRLVLSDKDFGRAYLAEGWASRFLVEVFRNFSVLFIGYSHSDPVMSYLARSLVPGGSARFALVTSGDDARWQSLGIIPIHYPAREGPGRHEALDDALRDWVRVSAMGVFDHDHRIKELLAVPPPIEPDAVDYLGSISKDIVRLRFFVGAARGREWLAWVDDRKWLDPLFQPHADLDECGQVMSRWLCDNYALDDPQSLFDLIQRKRGQLNGSFWLELTRALAVAKPRPNPELLSTWVVVLLQAAGRNWRCDFLDMLLRGCIEEERTAALLLFGYLSRLRPELHRPWILSEDEETSERVRVELRTSGDVHNLGAVWKSYFRTRLDSFHSELAPMLHASLQEAHTVLRAVGDAGENWDAASLMRSAIEPHEQDRVERDTDVVVDAARDLLEWLLQKRYSMGSSLRAQWLEAGAPLLRRVGLHGLIEDDQLASDDALSAVMAKQWLYARELRHEVFRLLKKVYGRASEEIRKQILQQARGQDPQGDNEDHSTSAYERYNLALWLHEAAPDCPFTTDHFQMLQRENPSFIRREYPDLASWGSGVVAVVPKSPLSLEELLQKAPEEIAEWLATYEGERIDFHGPDRSGLLAVVREAAAVSWEWTTGLIDVLIAKATWEPSLWGALLNGLAASKHTLSQWQYLLGVFENTPEIGVEVGREVVDLLEKLAEEGPEVGVPEALNRAITIAQGVFEAGQHEDTVSFGEEKEWLGRAINHVGGRATMLILRSLGKLREAAGGNWVGISPELRAWFSSILTDTRIGAERARTVLASQFHFLFGLDQQWATLALVPLFDWAIDPLRAEQAWHGYLGWGKWNDAILAVLLPHLEAGFSRLSTDLAEKRREFTQRLAGIALYSTIEPWPDGWLLKFIRDADVESRRSWALTMGRELRELSAEAAVAVWRRWMKDYWSARLTGLPQPLDDEEALAMVEWLTGLGSIFPEAVEMVTARGIRLPSRPWMFFEMQESPAIEAHPQSMAKLIHHLVSDAAELAYFECGYVAEIARKLSRANADRSLLLRIAEHLARLGFTDATNLRRELDT